MSTDLQLRQELLEIRLPAITVNVSPSSEITDNGTSGEDDCQTPKAVMKPSGEAYETPKSSKNMIPKILSCPPAPRKPRTKVVSCKRKLFHELQFFEIVGRDEIDSFFRRFEVDSKRRCLV